MEYLFILLAFIIGLVIGRLSKRETVRLVEVPIPAPIERTEPLKSIYDPITRKPRGIK